jgi:uncharacterized membrane protein
VFSAALSKIRKYVFTPEVFWWESHRFSLVLASYALGLGLFFTFLIPPFFKADELAHFFRTISITQGRLICPKPGGIFSNPLPSAVEKYPYRTPLVLDERAADFRHNQRVACTLPFLPYLPAGILLTPLVWLQADPEVLFYGGRLINLLLGLGVMVYALKITPSKLRLLPASIFLLPMTWHQMSSLSKDSLQIAFGTLTLSLILRFLNKPKSISRSEIILLIASLGLSIIARPQYLPLVLLVFMIPRQHLKRTPNKGFPLVGKLLLTALLTTMIALSLKFDLYSVDASKYGRTPDYAISNADAQVQYLSTHPQALVTVPYYTLVHHGQFIFQTMIGSFGSIDIFLDWFVYALFIILFAQICAKIQALIPPLNGWQLSILTLATWGSLLGVLLAMYLYATRVGNFLVDGLQGRYFIVLLPFTLWWLAELRRRWRRVFDGILLLVVVLSVLKVTVGWY